MKSINLYRDKFQSLSTSDKHLFIKSLSNKELGFLYQMPELFLFDKQLIQGDDWRYYILQCGRAFGKSHAGSAWLYRKIIDGAKCVAVCVPSYGDLLQVAIPALMQWSPPNNKPVYNKVEHVLRYSNGAECWCYSSDTELRGPNIEYLWCDEVAKWCESIPEKVKDRFDVMDYAVRSGKNPQTIITTTPKPFPLMKEWDEKAKNSSLYKIQTGSMMDNPFLPESFKKAMVEQYDGTRLGRQELWGQLLTDVEGALFNHKMIESTRISLTEFKNNVKLERVVIGVDPATTDGKDSDLTGIIVCGIAKNRAYVLADYSLKASPNKWANKVIEAYKIFGASLIVAEKNQGGDMVSEVIRSVARNANIKLVQAKKSKMVRAEPIAGIYQQQKVSHVGCFSKLEDEMCSFNGNPKMKSPDRLDALVYSLMELMINPIYTNRNFSNIIGF